MKQLLLATVASLATAIAFGQSTPAELPRESREARGGSTGIRIWQPVTITEPGRYVVVRNISAAETVITIQGSDVELDLGGFTLENTTGSGPVVRVAPQVLQNVTIENGTARGGSACFFVDRVTGLTLRGLNAAGCALGMILDDNLGAVVSDNRITVESAGILVDECSNCLFTRNTLVGGLDVGFGIATGSGNEISHNRVMNSLQCMQIAGTGALVRGNVVSNCDNGIELLTADGHIEGNVISNSVTGLVFGSTSERNVYRGNTSRGNGAGLLDQGSDNTSHGDNYLPDRR